MSVAAEQSLLGAMMLSCQTGVSAKGEQVLQELTPASFAEPAHRKVWKAIQNLAAANEPLDPITLEKSLHENNLDFQDSFVYLAEIANNTPSAANIMAYCNQVREQAQIRWLQDQVCKMQEVLTEKKPHSEKLSEVNALSANIGAVQSGQIKPKLAHEVYDKHAQVLAERRSGTIAGMTLGINCLDAMFAGKGGINDNDLIILAARPKMGKTQLAAQVANHVGLELEKPVLIFTIEMEDIQFYERMASAGSQVPGDYFYGQQSNAAFEDRLERYGSRYCASKIITDDRTKLSLLDVKATVRQMTREHGQLGLVLIDYHTLMQPEKAERADQGFGAITKGLKMLAKEMHTPILLLAQIGRGVETRQDKRPLGSDLRETGQAEQDLDRLIVLYREKTYKPDTPLGEMTEIIVRLNRHGKTGTGFMDLTDWGFAEMEEHEVERRKLSGGDSQEGWNG